MPMSRRQFVTSAAAASSSLYGAERLSISSVKAFPIRVPGMAGGAVPKFTSDFDPARSRWIGPFAQLGGAILVEITTEQGLTGYGMGGGGGAGAYIIERHLGPLITGANALNVEAIWEQIYNATLLYGRKGVTIMAISGVDNALWDICGNYAGKPVYKLLGGPNREKIPAYYTGFDMEAAVKLGFRSFKLPIRHNLDAGREG